MIMRPLGVIFAILFLLVLIAATPPSTAPSLSQPAVEETQTSSTALRSAEPNTVPSIGTALLVYGPKVPITATLIFVSLFSTALVATMGQLTTADKIAVSCTVWGLLVSYLFVNVLYALIRFHRSVRNSGDRLDDVRVDRTNRPELEQSVIPTPSVRRCMEKLKELNWDGQESFECLICLDKFKKGEIVLETCRYRSNDGSSDVVHAYHKNCWIVMKMHDVQWLCPMCRNEDDAGQ